MNQKHTSQGDNQGEENDATSPLPQPPQTPLYRATQADRYRRQDQIKAIEAATRRTLICYISGPAGLVERDDVMPLSDLLYKVEKGAKLDLMLHTLGGDVDAAEKITSLLLKTVDADGELRVIVPDSAKSAGTLIALAAQTIVMSDTSELGPIDPQVVTTTPEGQRSSRPAQSYLDEYEDLVKRIKSGDGAAVGYLLSKYDPALLDMCRKALERSRRFAENSLKKGMFRDQGGNFTAVAADLNDNARWLSHGAVISSDDATAIGLRIDYRDAHSDEWQAYWRLYCEQRLALRSNTMKLFESNLASLTLG
jgi:hypothetical protein